MSTAILGGGLSGLSAAYYLLRKNPKQLITIIEKTSRTGGWIKSNSPTQDILFEQGPRTIRPRGEAGANTLQLVEELGLSDKLLPILATSPAARNRMVYANGSLHMLPSSLLGIFTKQQPFSKPLILHLLNDITSPKKVVEDESIYEFISRRFGNEVADYLISPLICGICAGNAKEISVNFLLRPLFQYEQKFGSISKGLVRSIFDTPQQKDLSGLSLRAKREKWNVYSFKGGCETLPLAISDNVCKNGVDMNLNTSCEKIVIAGEKATLHLSDKSTKTVDHLISTIPSQILGCLVEEQHPDLSCMLKSIKNVSVAVINFQFNKKMLSVEAFGFLIAPKEQLPILGVIFDSCCFPNPDNCTVLTVMMGGYWFEHYFGQNPSQDDLLKVAKEQLRNILHINEDPIHYKVNILHHCIPQYVVGHDHNLNNIQEYIKKHRLPISLCGASYQGVGVNDVILSAKNVVDKL